MTTQQLSNSATQELSDDVALSVRHVSKKFCKNLRRSMAYGIADLARNLVGIRPDSTALRRDEFWALRDVSFDLHKGEALGLIGANGSGKSTLLRMIAGIFPPDDGEIAVRGRVGALIALGAGFHPHMTGRENIYLNGSILGMTRAEIDAKYNDIVEFSGIADFMEAPVSTYSSGMRVRLGFSVAVHIHPDVLLIDEVLAVGDISFRSRCYEKISELRKNCAIVFVSHQIAAVHRLCQRVLLLRSGRIEFSGAVADGCQRYQEQAEGDALQSKILGTGEAKVRNLRFMDTQHRPCDSFEYGSPLIVSFDVSIPAEYQRFIVSLTFVGQNGDSVAQCNSQYNGCTFENDGREMRIEVALPDLLLNPGRYGISLLVFGETNMRHLCWLHCVKQIRVMGRFVGTASTQWRAEWRALP